MLVLNPIHGNDEKSNRQQKQLPYIQGDSVWNIYKTVNIKYQSQISSNIKIDDMA